MVTRSRGRTTLRTTFNALLVMLPLATSAVELADQSYRVQAYELGPGESRAALVDFNQDGHLDLALASGGNDALTVLLGDGTGNLQVHAEVAAGPDPGDLDIADVNGDGHLDAVIPNHETKLLSILLGDGTGAFTPAADSPMEVAISPHPHAVLVRDMDRDGFADLLVDDRDGRGIAIFQGTAAGTFQPTPVRVDAGGDPYRGMAVGDLDMDGWLDLVTPNETSVQILLHSGRAERRFRRGPGLPSPAPFSVAIADLNGDGTADIVAASESGRPHLQVFTGDGSGSFSLWAAFETGSGGPSIAVGDVNGDQVDDLLVTHWSGAANLVFGSETKATRVALPLGAIRNPWGIALGDLNADGRDDLVIADGSAARVEVLISQPNQ